MTAFVPNAGDTTPPVVQSWFFSTQTVNLTGNNAGVFTVTARITDDLSGNAGEGYISSPTQIRFRSPSGKQFVDVMLSGWQLTSGTPQDGTYMGTGRIAPYSEAGTWTVETLLVADQVGNMKYYETPEVAAMGLDTTIDVTYNGASPTTTTPTTPTTPTVPTIPVVPTPSGDIPAPPGMVISGNNNYINYGTVTYTDSSTKNFVYTDNSVNYNYTTTSITTNKTYNGSSRNDRLTGAATNDLLAGGRGNDVLTGRDGSDTFKGGTGNDSMYGGSGLNTYKGGAGRDRMYISPDDQPDLIRDLDQGDRIFIQGATRGGLSVGSVDGGLGIFEQGRLAAIYTGSGVSEGQLAGMLSPF